MRLLFLFFVFPLAPVEPLFDFNVIFLYSWATFYFIYLCQILLEKSLWRTTYNKFRRVLRRFACTMACENFILSFHFILLPREQSI